MRSRSSFEPRRGPGVWSILGWIILVGLGVGLVWIGFVQPAWPGKKEVAQATGVPATNIPPTPILYPTFTPLPAPTTPAIVPSDTPAPVAVSPTAVPPTAPPVKPGVTVGSGGVNVRSGPGTNYTKLGYLEPGSQADVTGRYGDWWQISYNGAAGWVFGDLVTASNADGVAQVEPPPAPTAPPATAVPPTAPPSPTSAPPASTDVRGLHPEKFEVEGAPGPYQLGTPIWFHMWITNKTSVPVEYEYLGVQVEETGAVQKSWTYSEFSPNQHFYHKDQMHDKISAPGTYHLWLVIQFRDGNGFRLLGPVEVIVQ